MTQQGQRLEELLADVRAVVEETHSAVLDLRRQIEGQSGHIQQIGQAVQKLLEQHQLHRREVRPGDSLSIRNDNERQLVKQLVARYRALPDAERRQMPALLNGIGKLEVAAGDFDAARKDFDAVATLVEDNKAQAEAYCNAYQACLERRDWPAAIQELVKAVKLDAKRFAPFPVGKYQPQRILGAGGFGVAFLCKHKYMEAQVVVKTLMLDDLGRDADKVFSEAQLLRQLDHPAIIRISDCGYVDAISKSRPFLVMDYFEGGTLEEHVKKHGALSVDDVLAVARPVAEGLQAAHGKGILHRDVKPANLLVRKDGANWQAKVIDFGLALRQKVVQTSMNASMFRGTKTLIGESVLGTLDYAAPEQMGKRNDPVGPYSDLYGWAKTCCFALFQTTQPLLKHWQSIPQGLAELLEKCLDEDPKNRPQNFAEVLERLRVSPPLPPPPPTEPWYYSRDGKQTGPVSFAELVNCAQTGKIGYADMVWTTHLGSWMQAGSIPGLGLKQPPLPPPPPPPHLPVVPPSSSCPARKIELTGRWYGDKGDLWELQSALEVEGKRARGRIRWRLVECPPALPWANRVGDSCVEFVEGTLELDCLSLGGYRVDDKTLVALSDYTIIVSTEWKTFEGTGMAHVKKYGGGGGRLCGSISVQA